MEEDLKKRIEQYLIRKKGEELKQQMIKIQKNKKSIKQETEIDFLNSLFKDEQL